MPRISAKRVAVDKANTTVVIVVAVASFIIAFSLVASKSLLEQRSYQAKAESAQQTTLDLLRKNNEEAKKLTTSYQEFASSPENIIGGNAQGEGERDGDNPRLILDALPSKYDFPALLSSAEKVLKDKKFKIDAVEGDDDEVTQSANAVAVNPEAIEIPFSVTVISSATAVKKFAGIFESSIRPMQIKAMKYKYDKEEPKLTIDMVSYYQPTKNFNVSEEPIK